MLGSLQLYTNLSYMDSLRVIERKTGQTASLAGDFFRTKESGMWFKESDADYIRSCTYEIVLRKSILFCKDILNRSRLNGSYTLGPS